MADSDIPAEAVEAARLFHETYERLAPDFGYRTREASAKPWDEVPERNRALMIATCAEVGAHIRADERGRVLAEVDAALRDDERFAEWWDRVGCYRSEPWWHVLALYLRDVLGAGGGDNETKEG